MLDIHVRHKTIYGRDRFYPISKDAKFLALISNSETLSEGQLFVCKKAGCKINIENYTLEENETKNGSRKVNR